MAKKRKFVIVQKNREIPNGDSDVKDDDLDDDYSDDEATSHTTTADGSGSTSGDENVQGGGGDLQHDSSDGLDDSDNMVQSGDGGDGQDEGNDDPIAIEHQFGGDGGGDNNDDPIAFEHQHEDSEDEGEPEVQESKKRKKDSGSVPAVYKQIIELARARENIYMYGPTGSGKTHLARQVSIDLGLPFFAQPVSQGMDETVITGRILPDEDGRWCYNQSTFVTMYAGGGVYTLDEMDKADPNLLTFLNTALSNGFFYNELDGGRCINKHKDFILIATANSSGHGGGNDYFGEELDVSTLRRFQVGMVEVDYDPKVERKLTSPMVYLWGVVMRRVLAIMGTDRLTVSTGYLIKITRMQNDYGWSQERWEQSFFAGRATEEVERLREEFHNTLNSMSRDGQSLTDAVHPRANTLGFDLGTL